MPTVSERAIAANDVTPNFKHRIVTDEDLSKALDWLRDNAKEMGDAKARVIRSERMLQHTEALLTKMSNGTSADARKCDARTDARWLAAAEEEAIAAGEFEKMRALREAAALKIETWRSEQATYRAMKL